MRPRTGLALATLVVVLGGVVVAGLAVTGPGGSFETVWISDTPRDNEVNHHAVGVGPDGRTTVAPVAAIPGGDAELTRTSCSLVRLAPDSGAVRWRATVPPSKCFSHALTQPAIADADGDGSLSVFAGTTEDALVAYAADSGRERWRVPLSTYGYGRPTVADLAPAPGREIVAVDIAGQVVVASANGTVAWRFDLNDTVWDGPAVWAAPLVVDADGDGRQEVVVGTDEGTALLTADGRLDRLHNGSAVTVATAPAEEGSTLYTTGTSGITAVDGATGEEVWTRSLSTPRVRVAADGDGDGSAEVYVGTADGAVYALDADTGETLWSTTVAPDSPLPAPVLADLDGDGSPELVAVANDGTVAALDPATGRELAAYRREVPIWTFPTPADIDDDGREELLVRYGDGRVVALSFSS